MLEVLEEQPKIPDGTIIPCPDIGFKQRRVTACLTCKFFNGFGIMSKDESLPFDKRYAVRCSHVIERRTMIFEVFE